MGGAGISDIAQDVSPALIELKIPVWRGGNDCTCGVARTEADMGESTVVLFCDKENVRIQIDCQHNFFE